MSILSCASGASAWRGYDYCEQKKVRDLESEGDYLNALADRLAFSICTGMMV